MEKIEEGLKTEVWGEGGWVKKERWPRKRTSIAKRWEAHGVP
jgi:hypothetical protein